VGVVLVHAQERDPPAVFHRQLLKDRELGLTGNAPRRPQVDDDRVAAQRVQPRLQRLGFATEQLICLGVDGGQLRGRAPKRGPDRGAAGTRAVGGRGRATAGDGKAERDREHHQKDVETHAE
jgi:hypothetical protein